MRVCFETGSQCVAQAGLHLSVLLLPQPALKLQITPHLPRWVSLHSRLVRDGDLSESRVFVCDFSLSSSLGHSL